MPRASLVLAISTAQKIFAISSSRDKNSCHNFARLSAWCWRASTQADKRTLIQSVLIHGMCNFKDGTRAALLKRRLGYGNRPRMSFRGAKRRGNPLNRNANLNGVLPRASLVLAISTAQKIFAISSSRDKNSCHNFARLSAWWVCLRRKRINENLFKAHL